MSLNGAMFANASHCAAFSGARPVSVLEVHGKTNTDVPYVGGSFEGSAVPGALASATLWAQHNGCGAPVKAAARELLRHGPFFTGTDTEVLNFQSCSGGSGVSLWSVAGLGSDVDSSTFTAQFARDVLAFFQLHPQNGASAPAAATTLAVDQFALGAAPAPAPRAAALAPAPARPRTALQILFAGAARSPPPPPKAPPPPRPPTLLALIRATLEARDAPPAARAPAPTPARARSLAPAPAPAAAHGETLEVNAFSGPPAAAQTEAVPPAAAAGDVPPPPADSGASSAPVPGART
jgi:hypothetical protein